jgi:hypothetical protein
VVSDEIDGQLTIPGVDGDESAQEPREPTVTTVPPAAITRDPIGPFDVPESARTMINMSQRGRVIQ